jgi:hypothetical protein
MELFKPIGKRLLGRPRRQSKEHILEQILKKCDSTRNWIDLVQVRDNWRALVNVTLNLHGASYGVSYGRYNVNVLVKEKYVTFTFQ